MKLKQNILVVLSVVFLIVSISEAQQRPEPKKTEVGGHTMYTLLKPGDIPAIFEPEFTSVADARGYYYPEEPLMVVADGDQAKAYSIWHLDGHEIVNDYINGKAITVTW